MGGVTPVEKMPPGYPPYSYCTTCGRDFSGDAMFDRHRVGNHAYLYAEGLAMNPPREDGRRCLEPEEMRALGWRPFTDLELKVQRRHARRAGFGVELWHDPERYADARRRLGARGPRRRGNGQDASGAELSPEPKSEPAKG
jgi:hypothetical protein